MPEVALPDGFSRHFRRSGLADPREPLYSRRIDGAVRLGLRAAPPTPMLAFVPARPRG